MDGEEEQENPVTQPLPMSFSLVQLMDTEIENDKAGPPVRVVKSNARLEVITGRDILIKLDILSIFEQ